MQLGRRGARHIIVGVTSDDEKRGAIEQHWAASEAGDSELEHRLYAEDAVLDYPQSGERFIRAARWQPRRSHTSRTCRGLRER
jgi:hypothetical protein